MSNIPVQHSGITEASTSRGAAFRPTLLFIVAFALNSTPHEAVHAFTAYCLGLNSTLFQLWVNPDQAQAAPTQLAAIAAAGPIFSLALGVLSWLLYRLRFRQRPAGLLLLMLAIVGIYSFIGPLAGSALGGDFHIAFTFLGISKPVLYGLSALGFLLLPFFMFSMGRELLGWAPASYSRFQAVVCTTIAPWLIGALLTVMVYWPLPGFLIANTFSGSVFWLFAVLGAAFAPTSTLNAGRTSSITRVDLITTIFVLAMIRVLAHGIRLAH
jgi:hypothetical protein